MCISDYCNRLTVSVTLSANRITFVRSSDCLVTLNANRITFVRSSNRLLDKDRLLANRSIVRAYILGINSYVRTRLINLFILFSCVSTICTHVTRAYYKLSRGNSGILVILFFGGIPVHTREFLRDPQVRSTPEALPTFATLE